MPDPEISGSIYWQRAEEIFHLALELPVEARVEFLRARCGDDAPLEREVREILDSYEEQARVSAAQSAGPTAGTQFGAFETIRKIGEGGMGVVYLARRLGDFEQRAAIKVISAGPAGAVLLAERFRQERQILAGLEHPNIARLLDGGITSAGQSFLAMEYVEGVRLDEYCDSQRLDLPQRLALFRKICAAVHFAHQHLVIHRDLKPGNILVNEAGEPKLLDFGIAKVLAEPGDSPERTMTMTGALMLTPQYASPEQVRGLPCTVASDVYSLGVILFELLAGRGPYMNKAMGKAATPAEMIAAVVTQEIPRPSLIAPESEKASLRGDLDGIVLKALAKRPEDRYGSVEHFSEDIRRHMEGLPVSAIEGTRWYVARKFVRRHRLAVGAAALILLTLLGGLAATLWQARVAERERALAEQRFSDARKLANYLLFPLYDSVQSLPGSLPVRADMASQSLQYLDRLSAAKSNDRALRLELAEGYARLGTLLEAPVGSGDSLGDTGKALESDRKAVALLEPLSIENKGDARIQQDLAHAYLSLGFVLNLRGKPDEGVAKLTQAATIYDQLAAARPRDVGTLVDAGRAYVAMGDAVSGRGGGFIEMATLAQVTAVADKAIGYFKSALSISPAEGRALLGLAQAYVLKANARASTDVAQGLPIYRMGLDALQRLPPSLRFTPDSQALEAKLITMIGFCQEEIGQYAEAISTLAPAQEILDRLAAADPKNATNALRRVNLYRTRAFAHQHAGQTKDAILDYRKTIGILDGMIATDPAKVSTRLIRAELQTKLALMLVADGRMAEAEQENRASLKYLAEVADRPDAAPQNLNEAASAFISGPIPALLDYRRALRYTERADELARGKDSGALFYMAQCYEMLKDGPRALEAIKRALALLPPTPPGQSPTRNRQMIERHLHAIEGMIKNGPPTKDN